MRLLRLSSLKFAWTLILPAFFVLKISIYSRARPCNEREKDACFPSVVILAGFLNVKYAWSETAEVYTNSVRRPHASHKVEPLLRMKCSFCDNPFGLQLKFQTLTAHRKAIWQWYRSISVRQWTNLCSWC